MIVGDRLPMALEELPEDEFVICEGGETHLVGLSNHQVGFSPAVLRITNRRIIVDLQFEINRRTVISYAEIGKLVQRTYNECDVIDIIDTSDNAKLRLFIPDDNLRSGFTALVDFLCEVAKAGEERLDACAISLHHRFQHAESLAEFYETGIRPPSRSAAEPPSEVVVAEATAQQLLAYVESRLLARFRVIGDFLEDSPMIVFAIVFLSAAILSIVFRWVSFGAVLCSLILGVMIEQGLRSIRDRKGAKPEIEISKSSLDQPFHGFVAAMLQFDGFLRRTILWEDKEETLNLAAFLMMALALFLLFDPAFLLLVSVAGLAFFERWNFFSLGSLSSVLSRLILW